MSTRTHRTRTHAHTHTRERQKQCTPGHGTVGEQLEDEGRGDLVGHVGDADVKVGQVDLHEVAQDELQLVSVSTGSSKERATQTSQ
jgi:hypothetical protein